MALVCDLSTSPGAEAAALAAGYDVHVHVMHCSWLSSRLITGLRVKQREWSRSPECAGGLAVGFEPWSPREGLLPPSQRYVHATPACDRPPAHGPGHSAVDADRARAGDCVFAADGCGGSSPGRRRILNAAGVLP